MLSVYNYVTFVHCGKSVVFCVLKDIFRREDFLAFQTDFPALVYCECVILKNSGAYHTSMKISIIEL